ncbi:MAG: hypothetical protein HYT76_06475 [Deltaproteobacteria bacterium]|nr:hypothetical protein [Deltaproteobacteria bacterium]
MSIFSVFLTEPFTLSALERATEDVAVLQENIGPFARKMRVIGAGINNVTLSRILEDFRAKGGLVTKHLARAEVSAYLPDGVKRLFYELDDFILQQGGNLWSFGRSADLIEASLGQAPTDEILKEARSLLRGAEAVENRRVNQLLEGIHVAIATERETLGRSLFHAKLAVGGICATLLVGFSICAYFLSRPTPSYNDFSSR